MIDGNGSWRGLNSNTALPLNQWSHITAVYDGNKQYIYINGVLKNSTTLAGSMTSSATTVDINGDVSNSEFGNYIADDIKIYNYARTPSQIIEDMNGSHPIGGSPVGSQMAYWKFDEGYGTRTNNSVSVSTNTGNLLGETTPTWSNDGVFGKSIFFKASTGNNPSRMSAAPINMSTSTGSQITLTMWMKPSATQTNANAVFLRNGVSNDANYYSFLSSLSGGKFIISTGWYNGTGYTGVNSSTRFIPAGTWSHLGIVITQGTDVKYYLNGKLAETNAWTGANSVLATTFFTLGGHAGTIGQSYDGYIDEVKIYGTGLTEEQIKIDYNRGKSLVIGTTSTELDGTSSTNSASREYCVPGDTSTCSSPVGEWKLDEGSGATTYDTSGSINNGTLTASPTWSQGKKSRALEFNGTTQYVQVSDNSVLDIGTGDFSLSAWIYPTILNSNWRSIINKGGAGVVGYGMGISSGNLFACSIQGTSGTNQDAYATGFTLETNKWYHVNCVFDRNDKIYVYVNGQLIHSETYSSGNANSVTNALNFMIGRFSNTNIWHFPGRIDEAIIYNYARTPAQVAWEYNRGAPVAWYKLDECQGNTAYNSARSGNNQSLGSNGTITIGASGSNTSSGTCVGAAGQAWVDGATGKLSASLEFDGTDDYITAGSGPYNNLGTSSFTVAAWIKTTNAGNQSCIASIASSGTGWRFGFSGGLPYFLYGDGTNLVETTIGTKTLNDGNWHHLTIIYNSGGAAIGYLDGKSVGSVSTSSVTGSVSTAANLWIGTMVNGAAGMVSGQIDDVRIYNYPLTSNQIKQVFSNGSVSFK